MQGSSGTRAGLVYLLAGAALGAAIVLVLWMVSGGRPFGEIIGTADVSPTTPAAVQPSAPADRATTPASAGSQLESEPPAVSRSRELQFKKKAAAKRTATAKAAKAKKKARRRSARRKQVVRVVAPPPSTTADDGEIPVAIVPSPAPTAAPAPPAPAPAPVGGGGKPVRQQVPTSGVGAGEG